MKQTVNSVHLLYNNNRLHRHIVWAPYDVTRETCKAKYSNEENTVLYGREYSDNFLCNMSLIWLLLHLIYNTDVYERGKDKGSETSGVIMK